MRILLIGNGGREHALAWKLAQSPKSEIVYVAPGNGGTAREPGVENIDIASSDIPALVEFARQMQVGLTIIGPEAPLVAGVVDAFEDAGLACFGPVQAAARLEGSKAYSKEFMDRHGIPTAAHQTFTVCDTALAYLKDQAMPIVIKADGLAAGKGVIIAEDLAAAEAAVKDMLSGNVFGEAGNRVVIEEFLEGEEASFIVMADGEHALAMATSQDHKARDEGDRGPNTGGMGAYSPAPVVTPDIHVRIMDEVIQPVLKGMKTEGHPYKGFLYAGLMIAGDGTIKVLEFNCRFGDPETQPIMMRLQSDLVSLCEDALAGKLKGESVQWDPRPAIGVVLASGGYPGKFTKDLAIEGLDVSDPEDTKVFHAGTQIDNGQTITKGGRVLCVCGLGETLENARQRVYDRISDIHWPDMFFRGDIGHRALNRNPQEAPSR